MTSNEISRRSFLTLSGLSMAPIVLPKWLPSMAFSPSFESVNRDLLVCVFLRGGMDGLNAVIPHNEQAYYDARPDLAIPAPDAGDVSAGIELSSQFSLHPALEPLVASYEEGHLAIIHACGSPDETHSHFDAMDYMERGTPGEKGIASGWIARHLQAAPWENDSYVRAVGIGPALQTSLRGPVPAVAVNSLADYHLPGNPQGVAIFQQSLGSLYSIQTADSDLSTVLADTAGATFSTIELLGELDADTYAPEGDAQYLADEFGQGLKQIALLAKSGLGLEVACLDLGGWDTHVQQGVDEGRMPDLMATFAGGLAAFYEDMQSRLDKVTLVAMSEFGRRVAQNGNGGTDHGHGGVMFVLGGGIHGGKVYTQWPGLDPAQLYGPGDLAVTTDFRDVLGEIIVNRLGNDDLESVFPGYYAYQAIGFCETIDATSDSEDAGFDPVSS